MDGEEDQWSKTQNLAMDKEEEQRKTLAMEQRKTQQCMLCLNVYGANMFWLFLLLENVNLWFSYIEKIWGFFNKNSKSLLIILKQNLLSQAEV